MRKLCVSLMALVAVFFVSCSTETDIIEENDGGKDVTLTISTSPLTKSLDASQVGLPAPIDAGKELIVYFMDGTTTSAKTVASYKLTDAQIIAIQTTGGFKFTNLDPSVASVYVVANVPLSTLPEVTPETTLSAINAKEMNIADQQKVDASSVVLANTGKTVVELTDLTTTASNGNKNYKAEITLTPIVSRIQIEKVSLDTDETIKSFTLEGIYIDNFYQNMAIGGAFTTIISQAGVIASLVSSSKSALLYNEPESPAKTLKLAPTPQVYGYQFFPTNAGLSAVPYIILKLKNVVGTTRVFDLNTEYYVAVKAYKTDVTPTTASTPIITFEPGKIYTIANIPVSERNLVTDPTQSLINVTVNVKIANWDSQALNPDFGYGN